MVRNLGQIFNFDSLNPSVSVLPMEFEPKLRKLVPGSMSSGAPTAPAISVGDQESTEIKSEERCVSGNLWFADELNDALLKGKRYVFGFALGE